MVALEELLALWHGDEHSSGYAHPELVVAVCTLRRPANQQACRELFYRAALLAAGEVPEDVLMILDDGFHVWREREAHRCGRR